MAFFSIIIPVYNRAAIIGNAINSVLRQSFSDWELIIIDDGSTDNTNEVINQFFDDRIRYFKIRNSERSVARNYGLKQATGKYINYFDSDDIMYPYRLQEVYDFINSNSEVDVLYTNYDFIDEKGVKTDRVQRHYNSFTKDILFNNFLATDSVFLKRKAAMEFAFHEDRRIITAEDWELWLRVHTTYEFREYVRSTFAMVQHESRSLNKISASDIEIRDLYFSKLVRENPDFKKKYGSGRARLFVADRYTFIALSYSINYEWKKAIKYMVASLKSSVFVLKRKRFWSVLKKILWPVKKY